MVDDTNVDEFLESIIGGTLKGLAKSRIRKIAKAGLRQKPLQYPAGWNGQSGEAGGRFVRKEDQAAVRAMGSRNPARSKGGTRGRTAASMQKGEETRSAISRAGRRGDGELSRSEARRELSKAAGEEAKRTDRTGSTKLQKPQKDTPESRQDEKAARQEASRVRGFRRVKSFLNRKLKVGEDADVRELVDIAVANALNGKDAETDPNKINAAFGNVRKIVMEQIANKPGLDGAEKRAMQAEAKRMIAEAREALQADIKDRIAVAKGSGPKGAQAGGTRAVRKTPTGKTRVASDATPASSGQPRTNVGDKKAPPGGKPKRKRLSQPVPVGKKGTYFGPNKPGSVEGPDGKLQAPEKPVRKKTKASALPASKKGGMTPSTAEKIAAIEKRDKTRGTAPAKSGKPEGLKPSDKEKIERKKRADAAAKRKKMKESLFLDIVSLFPKSENV